MFEPNDSKKASRRSVVAGIPALGVHALARWVRAAEAPPLAERLAAYAAALRYDVSDRFTRRASIGQRLDARRTGRYGGVRSNIGTNGWR